MLDFTDVKGNPYKNIVIVGENGTGKSTILKTLAEFVNKGSVVPFDYILYSIDGRN